MKKSKLNEIKSIATILIMVFSVMAVFNLTMPSFKADDPDLNGENIPDWINLSSPANDTIYFLTSNITVTWQNYSGGATFGDTDVDYFLINATGPAFSDTWTTIHNVSASTAPQTWYWNVSDDVSRGEWGRYDLNVCGVNYGTADSPAYTASNFTINVMILPTPGVNAWQGGNWNLTTNFTDNKVLDTTVSNLKYGTGTHTITVDDSRGWNETDYYLYKPHYNGSYGGSYSLTWEQVVDDTSSELVTESLVDFSDGTSDDQFLGVTLDRAGLWLICDKGTSDNYLTHDVFRSYSTFNNTVTGWFWVNTTADDSDFVFSVSDTSFGYNSSGYITLSVKDSSGNGVNSIVDIRLDANESSISAAGTNVVTGADGEDRYYKNRTSKYDGFWCAGNYTAYAYDDLDSPAIAYPENNIGVAGVGRKHYNTTYGATTSGWYNGANASWLAAATSYFYGMCGPWDPPELDATPVDILVEPNTPYISVNNDTQYWGFDGEVNITIKESSSVEGSLTAGTVYVEIYDDDDQHVSTYFGGTSGTTTGSGGAVDDSNVAKGYIHINMTEWGKYGGTGSVPFADNGTWYAYIYVDTNNDRTEGTRAYNEEWNGTAEWTVKKAPKAQWKWIDDDGTVDGEDKWGHSENTNNDGVIPYVPDTTDVPLYVQFQVLSQGGTYFGALPGSGKCTSITECMENITLSGNALFTGTFDKLPGVDYNGDTYAWCGASNTWTVPIIPTISNGGGTITISVDAFNSTASGTLTIGASKIALNGTIASVTPNEIQIGEQNQTLTFTATNANTGGDKTDYCTAYLYYINDTGAPYTTHEINSTNMGESTMPFYKTQQKANQTSVDFDGDVATGDSEIKAPRNLTLFIDGPGSHDNGYALIELTPISDLELEVSHDQLLAGYAYDDFYINCTIAGSNGTEIPSYEGTDENNFHIIIYNDKGNDVTNTLLNGIDSNDLTGQSDYIFGAFNNVYATETGTYTIYAKNHTHNSEGYNLTLTVNSASVVCDKVPFIWKSDDNMSATFTITYSGKYGESVNGSLILDNISKTSPTTGDDYNMTWANTSFDVDTQSDASGNSSLEIDNDDITNGVVTVHDITAQFLPSSVTNKTITFFFKPSQTSSVYAKAGTMKIQVPSVSPNPEYIPLTGTTTVTCTVTGRGETLNNVYVRAHGLGVDTNGTSNSDGEVQFSINPSSTGNISIDVGEEGRTLDSTEAVIQVTTWKLDISVSPDTVDEGADFIVTVTEDSSGEAVNGATVTINGIGTGTTDSNGEVTFTAPSVTSDRSYTIKASKTGYAPETDTITIFVTNIPNLYINAPETVTSGETFTVVAGGDDGNSFGITVTFNGETKTTAGPSGITFKAPSVNKDTDYTITATKTGYTDATPFTVTVKKKGTPGFELLTLIAAIGVAFILLRRRRNK